MSILEVKDVDVFYGDFQALFKVNFTVDEGQTFAFIGANGGGKSTLLRTIAGLQRPTSGNVLFHGEPVDQFAAHKRVGMGIALVPEGRRVFPSLTVRENLTVFARGTAGGRWTLERILELFPSLRARERNLGFQLSGGEQQMLSIARALMLNPSLLLLDEPSEGLAPLIVQDIVEVLRNLKREGLAILLVEQNLRTALAVADRHHVMNKGEICFSGSSGELEGNEFVLRNYLSV